MTFAPLVAAALEVEIASMTRLVDVPVGSLGWGRDLSCVSDCTQYFAEVEPDSPRGTAEALVRRLTTPRGALIDDRDYGLDLRSACNRAMTQQELFALQQHAQLECTKDERVARAHVRLELDMRERSLHMQIRIEPADPQRVPFDFIAGVTADQVKLELSGGR